MKKTVIQWLNTLPEPIRSSALVKCNHNYYVYSLSHAIYKFTFLDYPIEDYYFWSSFHQALLWAEQLDEKDRIKHLKSKK